MTLREFLRLNLTDAQRRTLQIQCTVLMAEIDDRQVTDRDFVVRILQRDEAALWLLWFCLHSSFFVRVIRVRSKQECGQPCTLVDFKALPCQWSERVLGEFYAHLTSGPGPLTPFCSDEDVPLGLMDWLAVMLHESFHVEMLKAHGFHPLEQEALPPALRKLFARDDRFRTIFVNRWLWGLTEIPVLAESVKPPLPPETLLSWVEQVDEAILSSPETDLLYGRLQRQQRLRARSGIPPRNVISRS